MDRLIKSRTLSPTIPNQQILLQLRESNPIAWEHIYEKFSSGIFDVLSKLTTDLQLKEEIIIEAFKRLKENHMLEETSSANLGFTVLKYTYRYAVTKLGIQGRLTGSEDRSAEQLSILTLLSTQCDTLEEAASLLDITREEAKRKLHVEWKEKFELAHKRDKQVQPNIQKIIPFKEKGRQFSFFLFMLLL